jgi:hypothetical protein
MDGAGSSTSCACTGCSPCARSAPPPATRSCGSISPSPPRRPPCCWPAAG